MAKNKHHYVPKFYLKLFASDKARSSVPKLINIYNLRRKAIIEDAGLGDQCYKHKFYGKTDELEDALAVFEGECSRLILQIIETEKLPPKGTLEYFFLLNFIALQHLRTKQQVHDQNDLGAFQMS